MRGHALTDAPHLFTGCVAQHPVAFERIAQIYDTAGLRLQAFCRVIGQFCQGFGVGNAHTHRDTGVL